MGSIVRKSSKRWHKGLASNSRAQRKKKKTQHCNSCEHINIAFIQNDENCQTSQCAKRGERQQPNASYPMAKIDKAK